MEREQVDEAERGESNQLPEEAPGEQIYEDAGDNDSAEGTPEDTD